MPASDPPEPRPQRAPARRLLLIALACSVLAFTLRLGYLVAFDPPQETPGLARKYQACAQHLLAGNGYFLQVGKAPVPYVDRLPGYVTLLAAILALAGASPIALGTAHAALGALQAGAAALAGARLGGSRVALVSGLLVACWPPLWKSDVQLVETGVSGVVLTLLAAVALADARSGGLTRHLVLALLAFAALLLRPDYLFIPLMAAALPWLERVMPWRRCLAASALALVLPLIAGAAWASRNARVADGAFVSLGLGTNLLAAIGESVPHDEPLFGDRDVALSEGYAGLYWPDPARRDRERTRRALALIREHPGGYLRGCVRRVAVTLSLHPGRLWPGPTAEEDIRTWRAANPGRPRYEGLFHAVAAHVRAHPLAALGTLAWGPLALALAALGAWRMRRTQWRALLILLALPAYGLLVHVPLHAEPRYFFPFLPLLLVLAAMGLAATTSAGSAGGPDARRTRASD